MINRKTAKFIKLGTVLILTANFSASTGRGLELIFFVKEDNHDRLV